MANVIDEVGKIRKIENKGSLKVIQYEISPSGCWECISHAQNTHGYIRVHRTTDKGLYLMMHRYIHDLYHGHTRSDMVIMHSCDNPACINPSHLSSGTQADNVADKVSKGRQTSMPEAIAREIKYSDEPVMKLARRLGISKQTIWKIRTGRIKKWQQI